MTTGAQRTRRIWVYVLLTALLLIGIIANLLTGSVRIPFGEVLRILAGHEPVMEEYRIILFDLRLPRTLTALFAGIALSLSGLQMQTVFRNPLAGPYVLGITAGASLGVAIIVLGFSGIYGNPALATMGNWGLVVAAWIGSGTVLFLILMISVRIRDIMTILILGILFGSATTAIVSILQYFSSESMLRSFVIWTLGSLAGVTKNHLSILIRQFWWV